MTDAATQAVEKAIAKRIAEMTVVADENKAEEAQIEAIMGWQEMPADITDDQLVMVALVAQSNQMIAMQMNQDMLKAVFAKLKDISENDQTRLAGIMQKAEAFQGKQRMQPGISLQVVSEQVGAGWTAAAVLVEVDEDMNVKLVDKLDSDLYLGMYVTPHNNRSLTGQFNMAMTYTMAGQPLKPVTIMRYEGEGTVQIHVRGHMQAADGRMQPISAIVPVEAKSTPAPAAKKEDGPMIHPVKPGNPAP